MVVYFLQMIDDIIWGPPLLILLVGTGIYLTFILRGIQFNQLFHSLRLVFKNETDSEGDISSFAALCTALAGTVGTGYIVGVATAIAIGDLVFYFGCGLRHCLGWQPNIQRVY